MSTWFSVLILECIWFVLLNIQIEISTRNKKRYYKRLYDLILERYLLVDFKMALNRPLAQI